MPYTRPEGFLAGPALITDDYVWQLRGEHDSKGQVSFSEVLFIHPEREGNYPGGTISNNYPNDTPSKWTLTLYTDNREGLTSRWDTQEHAVAWAERMKANCEFEGEKIPDGLVVVVTDEAPLELTKLRSENSAEMTLYRSIVEGLGQ